MIYFTIRKVFLQVHLFVMPGIYYLSTILFKKTLMTNEYKLDCFSRTFICIILFKYFI